MRKLVAYSIVAVTAVMVFGGCSIYSHYSRPDDISTEGLFGENVSTVDSTSIASIGWREFFTDPQLQELIEYGLQNNIDLKVAESRIIEAEAALRTARLSYYPSFSFSPQGTLSTYNFDGWGKKYELPVDISWEVDVAGRLFNKKNKARVAYEQSLVNRRSVQTQLISAIANSYYTLLMLDSQLEVSRSTSANWRENVRIMKAMKEAGMTNEASVSQTEANSCSIDASLFDLERQISQVENSLSLILGDAPHSIPRGRLDQQKIRTELLVGVPAQLLANRPDVQGAELDLAQAYYTTNLARAAFYPSVNLGGTLGWTNSAGLGPDQSGPVPVVVCRRPRATDIQCRLEPCTTEDSAGAAGAGQARFRAGSAQCRQRGERRHHAVPDCPQQDGRAQAPDCGARIGRSVDAATHASR